MKFIKVTFCLDDSIHLINTDWIEEIWSDGSGSVIYMAFTVPDGTTQDHFVVKESIDTLFEMINGEGDK